jgi:predicted DNA-binding transcriptional regulator
MLVKSRREIAVRYYKKWRNKLRIENNVRRFVEIMERKTRNAIKNIFINGLIRKNGES